MQELVSSKKEKDVLSHKLLTIGGKKLTKALDSSKKLYSLLATLSSTIRADTRQTFAKMRHRARWSE